MNDYAEFLPRDKHDFDRVNKLTKMDRTELFPMLPSLMEWIQDVNWPIANEVAELLVTFPNEMIPLVKAVLATDDDVWKYWCLEILVKRLPEDIRMDLKSELIRLAERPTAGEKLEGLDETAMEILRMMG